MEKYYIDDDKQGTNETEIKITIDALKSKIQSMAIYADIIQKSPSRATVVVHQNIGTTMYLSSEFNNHHWLQTHSVKKEKVGDIVKYHFVLD
jgi:hypothetical protein